MPLYETRMMVVPNNNNNNRNPRGRFPLKYHPHNYNYYSKQQSIVLLLIVLLLVVATPSVGFQPPTSSSSAVVPTSAATSATHNHHQRIPQNTFHRRRPPPPSHQRQQKQPQQKQHRRREYPIFLASAGDEGIADSNIPMAVSFIGATTSLFVAGTFYLVLAWQRDAFMVAFFLASILNGIASKVLKRIINESRPPALDTAQMTLKPSDGGMPSSHAMSLGFIGTVTMAQLLPSWPVTAWMVVPYVVVSLWYRVRVKLHTVAQIIVGVTVGTLHALVFQAYYKEALMEWLRQYVLQSSDGLLPVPLLIVPLIVGALLVGSVERRISQWLAQRQPQKKTL